MEVAEHSHSQKPYREAGFKRIPVVAMILLQILTWGFYSYYWYLSRKKAIHHLSTERRFPFWYIWFAAVALFIINFSWLYLNSNGILLFYDFFMLFYTLAPLIIMALAVINSIINVYFRSMMLEHEGKDTDLSNQIATYLLAFFLGIYYIQYLINKEYAGEKWPEEDPLEEEGNKLIRALKKINGYNVMAAIALLIKIVVTINILRFTTDISMGFAIAFIFTLFWVPSGITSFLWTIVSFMLRKKKTGAWIILSLNVLDTIVLFSGFYWLNG